MHNAKETEKKRREIEECVPVANAMNSKHGTDYVAKPSDTEPADVIFESESGKYPPLKVQVVTVPQGRESFQIRADNGNVARLTRDLTDLLKERDVRNCFVGLLILENAAKGRVPREELIPLADAIKKISEELNPPTELSLEMMDLLAINPELTAYLGRVSLQKDESIREPIVMTPGSAALLPDDGQWIEQGVAAKSGKYPEHESELILVVGAQALVDKEQVDAFRAANPPESLPFAEIWVNAADGVHCVKGGKQ